MIGLRRREYRQETDALTAFVEHRTQTSFPQAVDTAGHTYTSLPSASIVELRRATADKHLMDCHKSHALIYIYVQLTWPLNTLKVC